MRYQLRFLLCCFRSFLANPPSPDDEDNYYSLLGLDIGADVSQDEIKRQYKVQSLRMHPDKLRQRGELEKAGGEEAVRARFQRMKEAYEALSDPTKRNIYDSYGERGLKVFEDPMSIDHTELSKNFANASIVDKSKIFLIFVSVAVALLIQPILACVKLDGSFGAGPLWVTILVPLWLFDALLVLLCVAAIASGPTPVPEGIEDWEDPSPMYGRVLALLYIFFLIAFEVLLALKLDGVVDFRYVFIFVPLIVYKVFDILTNLPAATVRIVPLEAVNDALGDGREYEDLSEREKEDIGRKYLIVPDVEGPEFEYAVAAQGAARSAIGSSLLHCVLITFVILKLDDVVGWNWGIVFLPVWVQSFASCCGACISHSSMQSNIQDMMADPVVGGGGGAAGDGEGTGEGGAISSEAGGPTGTTDYGSTNNGSAPTVAGGSGVAADVTKVTSTLPQQTTSINQKNEGSGPLSTSTVSTAASSGAPDIPLAMPEVQDDVPVENIEVEYSEAEMAAASQAMMQSLCRVGGVCCSQIFSLIIVGLFVGKLEGADYSSFWIIFPIFIPVTCFLGITGVAIYGISSQSDVSDEELGDLTNQQDLETGLIEPIIENVQSPEMLKEEPTGSNYDDLD